MNQGLSNLRDHLERLLAKEDDLLRALAHRRREPEPPTIRLNPALGRENIVIRRTPRSQNMSRPVDWIQNELVRVRAERERFEQRFLAAVRSDEKQAARREAKQQRSYSPPAYSPPASAGSRPASAGSRPASAGSRPASAGSPPASAGPPPAPGGRGGGVPVWVVGAIVVLAVLAIAGGSDSTLLSIIGIAVAVAGLIPTSMSAYFDYQAHRRHQAAPAPDEGGAPGGS